MFKTTRALSSLALAAVFALGALGALPTTAAAGDALTVDQAEAEMVALINATRASHGLLPVRIDPRVGAIARGRSTDMAENHYFSHGQPDGRNVFDLIQASGIAWMGAGEIIAWNNYPTLAWSAEGARNGWLDSPGHRDIVLSSGYNYFGIGLAIDATTGKKLWTGVFLTGPDRTGGWVRFQSSGIALTAVRATTGARSVRVRWTGGDVRLVVLTAGLKHFQIQKRIDGGSWRWASRATTATSRTVKVSSGHRYGLRVRACDRANNCGPWRYQTVRG